MRFDTTRAMEWVERFGFPRAAGSAGEGRAGELAAGELERLGLRVERIALAGRRMAGPAQRWLGWFGVAVWSAALEVATHQGAAWPVRLGLALGALLWLRLTTVEGFTLGVPWPWLRRFATTNVIAWRAAEGEPPPLRVVFHTPLDTFEPRRELVPRWLATPVIAGLLGAQVFFDLTINRNPLRMPLGHWAGLCCAILLWLAIGMRIYLRVRRGCAAATDVCDNRTGLALLLELARSWPPGTEGKIETRFVATGGRALGRAGLRALVLAIVREWPARPTLVVDWLAPGVGAGLTLMEHGTDRLAARAAADLWIPHKVARGAGIAHDHRPLGRTGPAYVGIIGSNVAARRAATMAIEPEALGRAAQLAAEIALRWARKKPGIGA
jgi:hypothetical protein